MKSPVNLGLHDLVGQEDLINKMIETSLSHNNFIQPVKVIAVDADNLTVDVIPLLDKKTVLGDRVESSTIYNVKYIRIQSAGSAIIIDPSVDDIGIVIVCDKDISIVKETKTFAFAGSNRIHSLSDSIYLGGFLNRTPTQYIRFNDDGIEIYSPTQIKAIAPQINAECDILTADVVGDTTINAKRILLSGKSLIDLSAPQISLNGALTANPLNGSGTATINMPLESTEDITAQGISLTKHKHGGVETGDGSTGVPT